MGDGVVANFKVAQVPRFRVSEVDLAWVFGWAPGGELLAEDGNDILAENGEVILTDDFQAKSYLFKVAKRPTFRAEDHGN